MPADLVTPMPGDRSPDFLVPGADGRPDTFYARYCGRPVALVLTRDAARLDRFAAVPRALGVVAAPGAATVSAAIPAMHDDGRLCAMLGLGDRDPLVWVLDAMLRLRLRFDAADARQVACALAELGEPPHGASRAVCRSAPVLVVPDVLSPSLCARLVEAHASDHGASGMIRLVDGRPTLVPDASAKRRDDHRLTDAALERAVAVAVERRVLPEIVAAFHYAVNRLEGFKVVSYDGERGGYFRLHRDNVTPDARHRRFALTVNLDDDYAGGCLHFPEYGPELYRPPPGGAIVFSGALLHEVTDVTRGRRHALLSFLWGEEGAR